MQKPRLYFTVTNDLTYDQRMIRICTSLAENGYEVFLVGRRFHHSKSLAEMPFKQVRLRGLFRSGFLFYAEFNIRLLIFLVSRKMDLVCAIDLDTIMPCLITSRIKKIKRVYDAHELFCEMKEVVTRPFIYSCWKKIEGVVPQFQHGYTVNELIASEYRRMYGVQYEVIRNLPVKYVLHPHPKPIRFLLYQGAVNEGRCFETLIPAMKFVPANLLICGSGNFIEQAKELVKRNGLQEKIIFKGKLSPTELRNQTQAAWAGITLFENKGQSNYLSLGNRFFDYMQAGLPQLCVGYPSYRKINDRYGFALLIDETGSETIAAGLNRLLTDETLHETLTRNALKAREELNWATEEKKLVAFYRNILSI